MILVQVDVRLLPGLAVAEPVIDADPAVWSVQGLPVAGTGAGYRGQDVYGRFHSDGPKMISSKTRSNCAGSFSAILIAKSRSGRVSSRSFDRLQRRSISCAAVIVSINRVLPPLKTGPSGDKAIL